MKTWGELSHTRGDGAGTFLFSVTDSFSAAAPGWWTTVQHEEGNGSWGQGLGGAAEAARCSAHLPVGTALPHFQPQGFAN